MSRRYRTFFIVDRTHCHAPSAGELDGRPLATLAALLQPTSAGKRLRLSVLDDGSSDAKTIIGGFKTMSGMDSELEIGDPDSATPRTRLTGWRVVGVSIGPGPLGFSDAGGGAQTRRKPGRTTFANIVLERG